MMIADSVLINASAVNYLLLENHQTRFKFHFITNQYVNFLQYFFTYQVAKLYIID